MGAQPDKADCTPTPGRDRPGIPVAPHGVPGRAASGVPGHAAPDVPRPRRFGALRPRGCPAFGRAAPGVFRGR
ncbi:hypothetical protein GCM10010228_68830 [Streptomyces massasporeus]|nr:hypothetical protein GCM10010228_68830 [Streptomyces massasporeus]